MFSPGLLTMIQAFASRGSTRLEQTLKPGLALEHVYQLNGDIYSSHILIYEEKLRHLLTIL